MALITYGTALDAKMGFLLPSDTGAVWKKIAVFRGGYDVWYRADDGMEEWWTEIRVGTTVISNWNRYTPAPSHTEIEMIGSTLRVLYGNSGAVFATITNSQITSPGVWQVDTAVAPFKSFVNLDVGGPPASKPNALMLGAGF